VAGEHRGRDIFPTCSVFFSYDESYVCLRSRTP
jgi:hypothetical protein